MADKKVLISAINYNTAEDAIDLIKSSKELNYDNFDILIIDNSVNDDYLKIKKKYPSVKIHVNSENIGVGAGCNQALVYAKRNGFDYLLMLDSDVVLDRDCVKKMVEVADTNENVSIVGGKSYFFDNKNELQDLNREYNPWIGSLIIDMGLIEDKGQYDQVTEVTYAWGGALLFNISAMDKIGPLDERYFLYYDYLDIQLRAKKLGFRVMYAPGAKLWHKVSQSQKAEFKTNIYFDYYALRNRILIAMKFNNLFQQVSFFSYLFFVMFPFKTFKNILSKNLSTIKLNSFAIKDALLGNWGRRDLKRI